MPRDSNGNFTLISGNPVVTGTTISSSWANTTLNDIATVLTASLDRSGNGGMLATFKLFDGTASAPGLAFASESATGFYRIGSAHVGWSVGGTLRMDLSATALTIDAINVVMTAPTGPGPTQTINSYAGSLGLSIVSGSTSTVGGLYLLQSGGVYGTNDVYLFNATGGVGYLGTRAAAALHIQAGNTDAILINGTNQNATFYGSVTTNGTVSVVGGIVYLQGTGGNGLYALPLGAGGTLTQVIQCYTDNNIYFNALQTGTPTGGAFYFRNSSGTIISMGSAGNVVIGSATSGVSFQVMASNGVHSTQIQDSAQNYFNAGYLESPAITAGSNRTCILSDSGKTIIAAASTTQTIPANTSVSYPVGTLLTFVCTATGSFTIALGGSDTLTWLGSGATGSRTLSQYGRAVAFKNTSTSWLISGINIS